MAKGKKTGGRDFQKGVYKGGPGRPKLDEELKELRALDRTDLEKCIRDSLQLTEDKIKLRLLDKECQAKERLVLRIILKGIGKGDQAVLGFLSDFVFGEKPKKIEVDNKGNISSVVVLLPANGSESTEYT